MRGFIAAGALCVLALALTSSALSSAEAWRVVKTKSVTGQFAVTATSATIRSPHALAVRFVGSGVRGQAVWACSKGFSVASGPEVMVGGSTSSRT